MKVSLVAFAHIRYVQDIVGKGGMRAHAALQDDLKEKSEEKEPKKTSEDKRKLACERER